MENNENQITDETRTKLKSLSKAMLRLHKILLDGAKSDYEAKNGAINGANQYLQLVLDDQHFAWLRKLSSMIALVDEATSRLRPATENEAQSLVEELKNLLNFQDGDEDFNDKLQSALQSNTDAVLVHNDALKHLD